MDIKSITAQLISKREALQTRIGSIEADVSQEHSHDWSEQAQERENDEEIDAIGNETRTMLNNIDAALKRIDDGSYGSCASCGGDIAAERLAAIPEAINCVNCSQ